MFKDYLTGMTKNLAEMFANDKSEIIVREPKNNPLSGYAEGELYAASVVNPDMKKLPEGIRDALERIDLRFKIDTVLDYLLKVNPAMREDFLETSQLDYVESHLDAEARDQKTFNQLKKEYELKGYLTRDETSELRKLDKNLRVNFKQINCHLEDTWKKLERFLREGEKEYFFTAPKKPLYAGAMEFIEQKRPLRKDSYDIYIQTLVDKDKDKPFGLMLCDGITSHYMTPAEAEQVKREGKNEFLSEGNTNSLKNASGSSMIAVASSWFGKMPEKLSNLVSITGNLVKSAYAKLTAPEVSKAVDEAVNTPDEEEESGPVPKR